MALETHYTKEKLTILDVLIDFTLQMEKNIDTEVRKELLETKQILSNKKKQLHFYMGNITPNKNIIFVFGSNPEGIHGAGSAKVALSLFGAEYGKGEGLVGNSYAIPTKDIRIGERSISPESIKNSIRKMYDVARQFPDKEFQIAYRNTANEVTLCGYSGEELVDMFLSAGDIPDNVYFSEEWRKIIRAED